MTERLYYHNPNLLEFNARIVSSNQNDGKWQTLLDKTAFYPTSGGQSHDIGKLNGFDIIDVIEDDSNEIIHFSNEKIGDTGRVVVGFVDENRRWKNRRLHTAQHIISNIFLDKYNFTTASVHLGDEYGAVELEIDKITDEQIYNAEQKVNEIVFRNFSVEILLVDIDQASKMPLRKPPKFDKNIRVIKIGEFEYSACGGTHCNSTGEVGIIKFTEIEKMRGRILLKFLCGTMALDDYRKRFNITRQLTQGLTCNLDDITGKIESFVAESKNQKKEIARLNKEILPLKVEELCKDIFLINGINIIISHPNISEQGLINQLAKDCADKISGLVVLVLDKRLIITSASKSKINCNTIVKKISEETTYKGGGSQNLAQMGGKEDIDKNTLVKIITGILENE